MGKWKYSSIIILDFGTRYGRVVSFTPWPLYASGKALSLSIAFEAGWAPEPVWTLYNTENILRLQGIEP
jgi:hypothetical protein